MIWASNVNIILFPRLEIRLEIRVIKALVTLLMTSHILVQYLLKLNANYESVVIFLCVTRGQLEINIFLRFLFLESNYFKKYFLRIFGSQSLIHY
jgi:hypothetical protein